jgi:hypothetical protein
MHPRQQQRHVRARLDGQPVPRLRCRHRKTWIHHDQVRAAADGSGEVLHLRVVHVLAQVTANERQTARMRDVRCLRRAHCEAVREVEPDVPRAATLRVARRRDVRRAVSMEQRLEPATPVTMGEERQRLGAVTGTYLLEASGDLVQRAIPGDRLEHVRTAAADPYERLTQPVRIVQQTCASRAARTETPVRQRVRRVARRSS